MIDMAWGLECIDVGAGILLDYCDKVCVMLYPYSIIGFAMP